MVRLVLVKIGPGKKLKKRDDIKNLPMVADDTVLLQIEIKPDVAIAFTKSDLDGLTYSRKKDINFGAFLERMADRITPKPADAATLLTIKTYILDRIMAFLDSNDWSKVDKKYSYVRDNSIDYLLHIYMGSEVSSNIVLRSTVRYVKLEDFLDVVVMQIPQSRRKTHKLKELFRIFYPDYHSNKSMTEMETADLSDNVEILFSEYGAKLVSDTDDLLQTVKSDTIPLKALLKDLSSNIHNVDSTEMYLVAENAELIAKLKNSMLDTFRGGPLMPVSGDDLQNLPFARSIKVDVGAENDAVHLQIPLIVYKRASDFLYTIYKQLPDNLKTEAFLATIVDDLFSSAIVTRAPATNTTSVIIMPKELAHLAPKDAPNVVIVDQQQQQQPSSSSALITPTNYVDSDAVGSILNAPTIIRQRTPPPSSPPLPNNASSSSGPPAKRPAVQMINKGVQVFQPHNSGKLTTGISEHIFVYIDIITPRRVAGESVRALKVIPYDGAHCLRFQNVEYIPLERGLFDSVSVQITDRNGELINFVPSDVPTYMQLHFKKLDL